MEITRLLARIRKLKIHSTKLMDHLLTGNYRSVFKGPGLEFSEVREYVEGDDTRRIDWNVSSRLGSAYTKTFREEREISLFLIVDMSGSVVASRGSGMVKDAADLIVSVFSLAALSNNDRLGACFFSDRIENWVEPRKGKHHTIALIQEFLALQPKGRGSALSLALRTSGEALKRRGIVVVLSDFKTSAYQTELRYLARKHDVIAIRLVPPEDIVFPSVGLVHMEDAETGRIMDAYSNSARFRKAYRDHWLGQRKQWFRDCRTNGVAALEILSDEDPIVKLHNFFMRRKAAV